MSGRITSSTCMLLKCPTHFVIYWQSVYLQTPFIFLRVDARAEFSYSSTDEGDKGHVRLRSNAEKSETPKDAETWAMSDEVKFIWTRLSRGLWQKTK